MLLIGIVTSVFTAVYFTRMLVALWIRRARPRDTAHLRQRAMRLLKLVPDNTNIDFVRWRNVAFGADAASLTVAAIAFAVCRGLNLGVDFVGGLMIRGDLRRSRSHVEQLRGRGRRAAASAKRASSSSAAPTTVPDPPAEAAGRRCGAPTRWSASVAGRSRARIIPGARVDAVDTGLGQGLRGAGRRQRARGRARDARHRDLHLVPLRMAVRRRRAARAGARRR